MYVASLHVYPVKGCKAIDLQEATFGPRSLQYDRHWIIVDAEGEKLTQREEPRLALIQTEIRDDTLTMSVDGHGRSHIDVNTIPEQERNVDVWGDDSPGLVERQEASQWLSDFLRQPVTLLRFNEDKRRDVVPEWGGGESRAHIAFNDCLPVLITNTKSLDALNDWRAEEGLDPCTMDRFRPNIVVTGPGAWEEDEWPAISNGSGLHLDITRPCSRCQVPNVDQRTGVPEQRGNLHVLGKRRLFRNYLGRPGAFFGVQALVSGCEGRRIKVGEAFEPTDQSADLPGVPRFV
jgi:uncharacterized protein YcbX